MHIFLDTLREPQVAIFDKVIRTFKEFVETVDKHEIAFISLDYELDERSNAIDVLWYLQDNDIYVPFINIHTRSNEARQSLRKLVKKYSKNSTITFIKEV